MGRLCLLPALFFVWILLSFPAATAFSTWQLLPPSLANTAEMGCPVASFSSDCGVDERKRCNSDSECGAGRKCCPFAHSVLHPNCRSCTTPVECVCNNEELLVCGRDSKTYRNPCLMECAGVEWACAGQCPCKMSGYGLGSCPLPNGTRTESYCLQGLPCSSHEDCDLSQQCCPDYNGQLELNCPHTCQDPRPEPECVRTKPYWLGAAQGVVSLIRFWIFWKLLSQDQRYFYSANAFFDVLEMIAMGLDANQGHGYYDVIMGSNSLLESIEIFWIIGCFRNDLIRLKNLNDTLPESRRKKIFLDGICSVIYILRALLVLLSLITFTIGTVPYAYFAGPLFVISSLLGIILGWMHRTQRNTPGIDSRGGGYPEFSGIAVCRFWFPFVFLFVALAACIQALEVIGTAGWHRILLNPKLWYMGSNHGRCGFKQYFRNGCKRRFFPLEDIDNLERNFEYIKRCGTIDKWIGTKLDWVIMIAGIL